MGDLAEGLAATVIARTEQLSAIPAPPMGEAARAQAVASWWSADGLARVRIDEVGNVWARLGDGSGPALVICAHLDTVFGREIAHGARREGPRLVGPGVGDDTVAVAALGGLAGLLPPNLRHPVWALATVGEEGLGNLRGITAALQRPPEPIGAVVALEGNYLGRVTIVGVGSVRWRVRVTGPGGHAWERADAASAVHGAADVVSRLARLQHDSRTSVNIGRIAGGEAINARARDCWFELDLRAERVDALTSLEGAARAVLSSADPRLVVTTDEIGRRPAGGIASGHPLVRCAIAALATQGHPATLTAASTDANAAYAAGVPAVTIGVTDGAGEHTEHEWIGTAAIASGMRAIAETVTTYDAEEW